MKKIFLLTALTIIIFIACEPKEELQGGGYTISTDGVIKGKLQLVEKNELVGEVTNEIDSMGTYVYNNEKELVLLKKDAVKNGNFAFTVPVPPDDYLIDISQSFENVNISNKTAKTVDLILRSQKDMLQNGTIKRMYPDLSSSLRILYVDEAVNITGEISQQKGALEYVYTYDIQLNKGWNIIRYNTHMVKYTVQIKITANSDPENMIWVLILDETE